VVAGKTCVFWFSAALAPTIIASAGAAASGSSLAGAATPGLTLVVIGLSALAIGFAAILFLEHGLARPRVRTARNRNQASASRLAAIVEHSDDAIIGKTLDGIITDWNPAAQRLYGYSAAEAIGRPVSMIIPPDRADELPHILRRLKRGERVEDFDTVRRRKDGTLVPVSVTVSPIADATGAVIGASAIARDSTERKRAEDVLRHRAAELESANRELESFSSSVSHDLRTPLANILGFTDILLEDYGTALDTTGRQYLKLVQGSADRMAQLVDDLLELAHVTGAEMRHAPIDLSAVAETVVETLRQREPERRVDVDIAPGMTAHGDERLLRVVLENLFANAWKFTRTRARSRIEFGIVTADGQASCFIRDNGVGFDMELAGRLFLAFQRLHRDEDFPGTGIGLVTVRRIVERHGGRVWAEAAAGRGATFYLTLPGLHASAPRRVPRTGARTREPMLSSPADP
jgi:PAS domain S-box-containing protein